MAFRIQKIKRKISFYKSLSKDKETLLVAKFILITAVVYLLSPIDLIPDFIPVLGYLDDLVIVPFLLWLALLLISKETKIRMRDEQNEFI